MSGPAGQRPAAQRGLAFMSTPSLWQHWPVLPVVRHRGDGEMDTGLMYDTRGATRLAGLAATVFLGNLFLLSATLGELLELPRETYDNFEEVVAAGWHID